MADPATGPAWAPLRRPDFRALWIAALASQVGTWVHDVGAAWLMTSLSPSPLWVSLVQTAGTLPLFALALPAGALADVVDRRRLLIAAQLWMAGSAAVLAVLSGAGHATPLTLLALTASLSMAAALGVPAWQATIPELVPRDELGRAVTLNGLIVNLSRTVGPGLGGLLVGLWGPASAFAANALSYLAVVAALVRWRRAPRPGALPPERFWPAIRAGLRYARHAQGFGGVLVRAFAFLFPASALWALLPLFARRELGVSALGYGLLIGCVGLGALAGAALLGWLRAKLSSGALTALAAGAVGVCLAAISRAHSPAEALPLLAAFGAGWLVMLSTLNTGAQALAAGWARARVLAVYLLAFFGSLSLGSVFWGALAGQGGLSHALWVAGVATLAGTLCVPFFPLLAVEGLDLTPSLHWPDPGLEPADDREPVLVTIEYRVRPQQRAELLALLEALGRSRRRDGALSWQLIDDPDDPSRVIERFVSESRLAHLRQHQRVTEDDRQLQERIRALQDGEGLPRVRHQVGADRAEPRRDG